jgi:multidrug resistance efflux pump
MKRTLSIFLVLVVGAAAFYGFYRMTAGRPGGGGLIHAPGRVEGDHVVVAARSSGTVTELPFGDGESVTRGEIVARVEDSRASERAADARLTLASLESRLRSEHAELAILQTRVPLMIRATEAGVTLSHAVLQQYENEEDQRRREVERLQAIQEPDDETKQQLDDAELSHEDSERDVVVAQAAVERAESDLALARAGEEEISTRIHEVEALRTERDVAETVFKRLESAATSTTVMAPISGVVASRRAAVGDEADAGMPLLEIVASDAMCVVVRLSDQELKLVATGQAARFHLESQPDVPHEGRVTLVGPGPEGAADRWNVRLLPNSPQDSGMVLGMRAQVIIRIRDEVEWARPRW